MITKHALLEAKALIRTHTAIINAWAGIADGGPTVAPQTKEALLDATARLYELVEGLPSTEAPTMKTDMEGFDERT